MKDKVKYGHELLDIEIPEGTDLSILLPKQHPTGVRSEEEIVEDALDQKRMAEVNVECYPKEQLNEVIRTVLAEYDHPKVLYMPQATLTLPLAKE